MTSTRKKKKQMDKAGKLAKQTDNLSTDTPKQNDLVNKSKLDIPPITHEIIKTPIQLHSDQPLLSSCGKINYF